MCFKIFLPIHEMSIFKLHIDILIQYIRSPSIFLALYQFSFRPVLALASSRVQSSSSIICKVPSARKQSFVYPPCRVVLGGELIRLPGKHQILNSSEVKQRLHKRGFIREQFQKSTFKHVPDASL